MSSSNGSFLRFVLKATSAVLQSLPLAWALGIARGAGRVGYYLLPKKRKIIYTNLRTVYPGHKSPQEIRQISKKVFVNFAQSLVEILCLPKIKRLGFRQFVTVKDQRYVDEALSKGKGLILLAVHSGNWELASVVGSEGYAYNVVAHFQAKAPQLANILNEYRAIAGAKVIDPGTATRDIIRALQNNEIVTLVLDQGGKDGTAVKFLGRTASMSTGAIRLGLKYGTPVMPVWNIRNGHGHCLTFFSPLDLTLGEDMEKSVTEATARATEFFAPLIYDHPDENMWFYKVFKYSTESHTMVLDDGKTGHLRQSQAVGQILSSVLNSRGKSVREQTILVNFKTPLAAKLFSLYAFLAQYFQFLCREEALEMFVTKDTYQALLAVRADFIIACGSMVGSVNFFLSRCYNTQSICLLKPGLVSWEKFNLVIAPEHDRPQSPLKTRLALTQAALNLITPDYLQDQSAQLLNRYSHLKTNVRAKIGVLLGGDTKGIVFSEAQARLLIRQLKEAAVHFNMDLLVTTSRRTSVAIDSLVARELKNFEQCALCIIANESNVSEAVGGILGLSDLLIVSGESVSMVSEAVCSGKRTIVFPLAGDYAKGEAHNKYDCFVLGLNEAGFLLACAVKDLSDTITNVMRNKLVLKTLDDRTLVLKAIEEMV